MRLHSVAYHLPDPEGTAAGRVLHATIEGLLAEGHDVTVQTWWPDEPSTPLPDWCEWTPVPVESVTPASRWDRLVQRVRAGREATALELDPPPGTVVVALGPVLPLPHAATVAARFQHASRAAASGRSRPIISTARSC